MKTTPHLSPLLAAPQAFPTPTAKYPFVAGEDEAIVPHHAVAADTQDESAHLFNAVPCGYYLLDAGDRLTDINVTALRWLGFTREQVVDRLHLSDLLTPHSRITMKTMLHRVRERGAVEGAEWEMVRADGTTFHALLNLTATTDLVGRYVGSHVALFDITARRKAEDASHENQERLRLALTAGRMGIWDWDIRTEQVYWTGDNRVLHDLTPVPLEEDARGSKQQETGVYLSTIHPSDRDDMVEVVSRAIRDGGEYTAEYRVIDLEGVTRWVSGRGWVQLDASGDPERIRGVAQDITERKLAELKIAELATTDGLTGLKNHRAFQEALQREILNARRHAHSLSLLLMDVDHFKRYNDSFGHPEGDRVLQAVARSLTVNARDTDFVARYGGEEFAVILPRTDGVQAVRVAERMRIAISQAHEIADLKKRVTASIGVASLAVEMNTDNTIEDARRDLIVVADWAMYEAKHAGRNRVYGNF